jgi:hypothetical protein
MEIYIYAPKLWSCKGKSLLQAAFFHQTDHRAGAWADTGDSVAVTLRVTATVPAVIRGDACIGPANRRLDTGARPGLESATNRSSTTSSPR